MTPTTVLATGLVVTLVTAAGCSAPRSQPSSFSVAATSAASSAPVASSAAGPGTTVPLHPATVAGTAPRGSTDGARVHPDARTVAPAAEPAVKENERSRCVGTHADQLVIVSIALQRMWLCHHGHTVRRYPVTTGQLTANTRTPTGTFHIQGRNRNSVLTLSSGRQYDVKYWIPFDAPDFGFHDSPWQKFAYGSPRYRTRGSHGCVHMPLRAIRFFYDWVEIGALVRLTAT